MVTSTLLLLLLVLVLVAVVPASNLRVFLCLCIDKKRREESNQTNSESNTIMGACQMMSTGYWLLTFQDHRERGKQRNRFGEYYCLSTPMCT